MQLSDATHLSFPPESWGLTEQSLADVNNQLNETLFALGNGYIGLRACAEEGEQRANVPSLNGSYLNGFYESEAIQYPENAYGLARTNQFMLNVPNAKCIELHIEDEVFDLQRGSLDQYQRHLDFKTGLLTRTLQWTSPKGRSIRLHSQRLVSFDNKHLFAISYEVTPLNFSGRISLTSSIDSAVKNIEAGDDPRVGSAISGPVLHKLEVMQDGDFTATLHRTHNSGLCLATAQQNCLHTTASYTSTLQQSGEKIGQRFDVDAVQGQVICLEKFCSYYSSRDFPAASLLTTSKQALVMAQVQGFTQLAKAQRAYLDDFWAQADVRVSGDAALQQGIHFNMFHLLQSVGRDGKTNIAAKGLTGEGYEGHYFWDTEIYIFPFFLYNKPEIAKKLLEYRYQYLPQARERARQLSHASGALYPWRTIDGEECSAYFPAGTAQYHINADIAYSIKLYMEATGDTDFLLKQGAEIVLETARLWMGLGHFTRMRGQQQEVFCINEVTGPDEYTAQVNNNYYTNAMAQMHLRFAVDIVTQLQTQHAEDYHQLAKKISLDNAELDAWQRAAALMFLPYDAERGIHEQDDSFLNKKPWDFAATPKDNYPLLLHYHPLVIYRHQVCKQADVLLALLLLSDQFALDDKRRDFDFYEAVTTHDSSLSTCIFSIIAAEVGYHDKAYDYFMQTARLDLDNTHGNTHYGVHTAAMGGTWLGIAYGFGGMRIRHVHTEGGSGEQTRAQLSFAPVLPRQWQDYQFRVHFQGQLLELEVNQSHATYRLLRGNGVKLNHGGQVLELTTEQPVWMLSMPAQEPNHA
ncbi:glycosyl hydrolase family 65 protein [Undibacterium sp. TS12]|uniref:glycoside hydrolase family 65 protein n=1 Tax=Undibacterium sp. TS12 TaxID=2908202 RepID=UPI001F4C8823|nr:glycoside hydrolase family 65 protein [Undibacterium sp. TS12]